MSSTTPTKLRVASHGKRLFALILDFAFALLLVNTINHLRYQEHWDLTAYSTTWEKLIPIYLAIYFLLLLKDLTNGRSPGKFIFGITVRTLDDLSQNPSLGKTVLRNLSLLIFPIEGVFLLMDSHGRRLGDQWCRTVVIEDPKARRFIIRLMAANTIFFGYFFSALLIQPLILKKTAAYQTTISYIQNTPEIIQQLGEIQEFESPEMNINVHEQEGNAIVRMAVVGRRQTRPVTVYLKLIVDPKRFWELDHFEIGKEND